MDRRIVIKTVSILGSGWLGLPLIKNLVDHGFRVKASTTTANKTSKLAELGVEPYIVDIDAILDNIQSFLDSEILIVNITSKNIAGFQSLVEQIEKSAVQKVLFVSSTSVYDNQNKTVVESSAGESVDKPLFMIEKLFRNSSKVNTTVIRFAGLIGKKRHPGRFFRGGKIVKDPDAFVNLIHLDDCLAIMSQILEQAVWGEVFNCCADSHPTKREYYTKAAESLGLDAPEFATQLSPSFKIISNQKVKQYLNYNFKYDDLINDIKFLN